MPQTGTPALEHDQLCVLSRHDQRGCSDRLRSLRIAKASWMRRRFRPRPDGRCGKSPRKGSPSDAWALPRPWHRSCCVPCRDRFGCTSARAEDGTHPLGRDGGSASCRAAPIGHRRPPPWRFFPRRSDAWSRLSLQLGDTVRSRSSSSPKTTSIWSSSRRTDLVRRRRRIDAVGKTEPSSSTPSPSAPRSICASPRLPSP